MHGCGRTSANNPTQAFQCADKHFRKRAVSISSSTPIPSLARLTTSRKTRVSTFHSSTVQANGPLFPAQLRSLLIGLWSRSITLPPLRLGLVISVTAHMMEARTILESVSSRSLRRQPHTQPPGGQCWEEQLRWYKVPSLDRLHR